MRRCAQLLCVRCLLSEVEALTFNYQKMFAVGSVPLQDHQGRCCRCPRAPGLEDTCACPGSQRHHGRARLRSRVCAQRWGEAGKAELLYLSSFGGEESSPALSALHPPLCWPWHPCGGLIAEQDWQNTVHLSSNYPSHLPEPCHQGIRQVGGG